MLHPTYAYIYFERFIEFKCIMCGLLLLEFPIASLFKCCMRIKACYQMLMLN